MRYCIYLIMCKNNKFYIGITSRLKIRIQQHLNNKDYKANCMKKYGYNVYVLSYNITQSQAEYIESVLVNDVFVNRNDTLNLIEGGAVSPMTRPEIRQKLVGRVLSEETRRKISLSHMGSIPWNKGETGIYSKECLEKMSKSKAGKAPFNKGKTGIQGRNKTSYVTGQFKGEKHKKSKISDSQRLEIYNRYKSGETPKSFAHEYGIHWSNVYRAVKFIEREKNENIKN